MLGDNVATIELVAEHSRLAAGLRAASSQIQAWAKSTRGALGGVVSGAASGITGVFGGAAVGMVKAGASLAMFGAAARGLDIMVDGARDVFTFEKKLTRFGIAANLGTATLDRYRAAARATSVATGQDANTVLDSARKYIDLAGAQNASINKMNILARTGAASEAAGGDLAGMMYQLTRSFKVTEDQMENTMGGLINQAKEGAIEAKQMAQEFAGMAPIFARFGVVGREGAIQLGAMYQVTRDGFDSAAQAATGMIRLMAGFQRHASRFAAHGVQVFKPGSKSELRQLSDIMAQVSRSDLAKDTEALVKAFGRSEAWRTFQLLAESPQRLRELEEAGRANNVVQQDLARYTESTAGRLEIAMAKVKNAFADALTPERIDQIVGGIETMTGAVGPLIGAISKVVEGFGNFIRLVERGKAKLMGDSHKELSPQEEALVRGAESGGWMRDRRGREHKMTAEEMARAKQIQQRKAEYDHAIDRIMEAEDEFGPTDESIRRAIEYGRSATGRGPQMPGDQAGIQYLAARDKEISTQRYKRIEAGVAAQDDAAAARAKARQEKEDAMMWAPRGMSAADITNKAATDAVIAKAVTQLSKALGEILLARPAVVNVDGNPVAKAAKNATDQRRR